METSEPVINSGEDDRDDPPVTWLLGDGSEFFRSIFVATPNKNHQTRNLYQEGNANIGEVDPSGTSEFILQPNLNIRSFFAKKDVRCFLWIRSGGRMSFSCCRNSPETE